MTGKWTNWLANSANVVIIVAGVALFVALLRFPSIERRQDSVPYRTGEKMGDLPAGFLSSGAKNLVLVMTTTCRFCEESVPFYKQLSGLKTSSFSFNVIGSERQDDLQRYLHQKGIEPTRVVSLPRATLSRVTGTPTLLLLDDKGVILNVWIGKLPDSAEAEVIRAVSP